MNLLFRFIGYLMIFMCFFTAKVSFAEEQHNLNSSEDKIDRPNSAIKVDLVGIESSQIRQNVLIYVDQIIDDLHDGGEYDRNLLKQAVDKGVRAFGYYESEVDISLDLKNDPPILTAKVKLGDPVKLEEAEVKITGQALQDREFLLLNRKLPQKGEIISHQKYEDYKKEMQQLAQKQGYFDAEFLVHRLEIMPETKQGWWRLYFDSGDRYHYGEIHFHNAQIREDYLRNMLPIRSGNPYFMHNISSINNIYSSSGWFSSVLAQPKVNHKNKSVDIELFLQPKKKNSMELGIGYSSDVGMRFQMGWKKPWINRRGHSFSSDFYVSSPKQTIEATYRMPLLENAVRYYYDFSVGLENEKELAVDTKSTGITLAALRYWNHSLGWQYSLGLKGRYDSFVQGDFSNKTLLIYPTAGVNRTRMRGGLFPYWGDSQKITVDLGKDLWFSEVDFLSVRGSTAWIRTYEDNHRFLSRLEVGYLHTKNVQKIPPALRFFAGGDRSVRGYGYKKISPKDAQGKYVGGSKLMTGSLEYQYQVYPDWWIATFVDAGFAANKYDVKEVKYGSGFGVRWASPVGAIKFDLATPIRDKEGSKNIQFYIGLGSEI